MSIARAAPMRRAARRAIVRTRMIARPALAPAVPIEAATLAARAGRLKIAAASIAVGIVGPDRLRRVLHPRHMTRLAALVATRLCAPAITLRVQHPAAGARSDCQREHDQRAFHLSPLRTTLTAAL
jgi:hypothetical protein